MKVPSLFPRAISVLSALLIFLALAAPHAQAQNSFSYPPFPATAAAGLKTNGNASVVTPETGSNFLQVTPATNNQVGSAWYTNPTAQTEGNPAALSLVNGFTTTFTFQFTQPGTNCCAKGADGIAFVVQNGGFSSNSTSGAGAVGPSDGMGGEIGFTGLTNSVAVQFDTFYNSGYGDTAAAGGPTSTDQITIESCGAAANTVNHSGGCQFGTVDLSRIASAIYIGDGNVHTAQISYSPPANVSSTTSTSCPVGSPLGTSGCGSLTVILDGQTVLTVAFNLFYLGLDSNADAYAGFTGATGGSWQEQDVLTWNFMADQTSTVSQPVSTTPTNGAVNLPEVFSSTTGQTLNTDITYVTNTNLSTQPGVNNPIIVTTNMTIPPGDPSGSWPQYVVGTPWAPSQCTIKAANGPSGLCSLYTNACFQSGASSTTASDANCPTIAEPNETNYVLLQDTFDWVGKWTPTPGMTASLIAFTVPTADPSLQWTGSTTSTNPVCPTQTTSTVPTCYLADSLIDVFGDQTTTRGSRPKSKAWIVSAVNVPMLTTNVTLTAPANSGLTCSPMLNNPPMDNPSYASTVWNNGACIMDFVVNPAQAPSGNTNSFQAAEPAFLEYGSQQGAQTSPPALAPGPLPPGDQSITNPNPVLTCGVSSCSATRWDTAFNQSLATFFGAQNGTFTLHWSAKDTAGITEKNITLSPAVMSSCPTPNGPVSGSACYTTNYYTTQVNIDSTSPTIASAGFSTPGNPAGTFYQGQTVYPIFTCSDNLSGLMNCGGAPVSCPLNVGPTILQSPTALNTSTPGLNHYTATATDCAGNASAPLTINYNVVPSVNLQIKTLPLLTLSVGIPGLLPVTYGAAILNQSAVAANDVTVTTTFSVPAGIVLGTPTGTISTVTCSNTPCTLKGITISSTRCSISGSTVTCSVPTLGPASAKTGLWLEIAVPIAKNSKTGQFSSTSTVSSAGVNLASVSQTYYVIF